MNSLVLFIFWPLLGLINAFFNFFSGKRDKLLLTLLSGFVGLNIAITSDSPDVNRYVEEFVRYTKRDFDYIFEYLYGFITLQEKHYDIGVQLVYYLASRVTSNEHIFLLILGLVYGFFFSRVMIYLFGYFQKSTKKPYLYLLTAVLICFYFPTQGINQFRFWTASLSFIYGYLLLSSGQRKGYFFIGIGPLFHIGISFIVFLYGVLLIVKRVNYKALLLLIPLGLALNIGFSGLLEPLVGYIGGSVEDKFVDYTGEQSELALESFKGRVWYAAYWRDVVLYGLFLLNTYVLLFKIGINNVSKEIKELFNINIVFLFAAILLKSFFMHFRYYELFVFFNLIFLIKLNYHYKVFTSLKTVLTNNTYIGVFLFILFIKIPGILQFLVPTFFISNFATAWFFFDLQDISTWDFIRQI